MCVQCNSGYIEAFRTWLQVVIPMQSPLESKFILISIRCDMPKFLLCQLALRVMFPRYLRGG